MSKWKVYEGSLRRCELKLPHLKISLEKCSNLEYDYKWILKGWNRIYIDVGVYELLYNILCVYYYRMIYIMVIHDHQKQDKKPHTSTENRTTPCICEILEKHTVRKG